MQKFLESQDFKDMNVGFGLDEGSFQSKRILINLIFFFLSILDSLKSLCANFFYQLMEKY